MKQMDECLDRAFAKKEPLLSKKWKSVINGNHLILTHYHHLVLVFDIESHKVLHQWWERPTDRRGLDAAIEYLEKKFDIKLNV